VAPECFEQEQETGLDLLDIAQMDEASSNAMLAALLAITDYLARLEQHIMTAKKLSRNIVPVSSRHPGHAKNPRGIHPFLAMHRRLLAHQPCVHRL
jgi:hypothetical protein